MVVQARWWSSLQAKLPSPAGGEKAALRLLHSYCNPAAMQFTAIFTLLMAAKLTHVGRFVIWLFQTFYFSASWTLLLGNKLGHWKVGPGLKSMKMHEEDFRLNGCRHF